MSTTPAPQNLADTLAAFALEGRFLSAAPYGSGHINDTFQVLCETRLGRPKRYIAQRINDRIFRNVPALMDNIQRVTAHLGQTSAGSSTAPRKTAAAPEGSADRQLRLILTRDAAPYTRDAEGGWWRVYDFIEAAHTIDRVTAPAQAREAARAFGDFQAQLAELPGPRLHETIPHFHNTRLRFESFRAALASDPLGRAAAARAEIDFALSLESECDRLLDLFARGEVSERITHNDTKINNVMLDDATGRAVAVIDFDTLMPGLPLYDFGDMVRTAASSTLEDDPEPANMRLEIPLFAALVEGYMGSHIGPMLSPAELAHLGFAGKLMTYETGLRFLADHLQGDVYFKTHYAEHNLVRARTQFALVRSIDTQADAINRILDRT
ncbi:hypothetical protein AXK11_06345 [Cephaloticoccus primus]|uniref:Aminoglycoside phosphotransferase domain-containing protein n=1 Tax=Cephaloticoccus primus TaxID=1548207 RepID=A0A139SLN0_9BACT|nr:aminoglycoside phosphotransferase family protein [Cephaloticoccus primus]KXU35456.1 hypothetical protein AXK11_06345 [Cephaloticoccus primus]